MLLVTQCQSSLPHAATITISRKALPERAKQLLKALQSFLLLGNASKPPLILHHLKKWNSSKSGKSILLFQRIYYAAVSGSPSGGTVCRTLGRVISIQTK